MIEELRIKDYAIIDHLNVPLKRGFNVLTGETGAGKSIIVDALGILLKEKISSVDFIKHGKTESIIEVVLTDENSQDKEEITILKRVLNIQGKNRAYINDSTYTIQNFVKFASQLINIHGQHEHTYLLKRENHLVFLDTMAGLKEKVEELISLYEKYQKLREEVEHLRRELEVSKQKLQLYQYQLEEIRNAQLSDEEERELYEQRDILKNIFRLKEIAEETFNFIYEEKNSVYSMLSKIRTNLDSLAKFDSKARDISTFIDSASSNIEEAIYLLRKLRDSYESDPYALDRVEQRISLINRIKSKYGNSVREVLQYADELENKIRSLSSAEEDLEKKEKELEKVYAKISDLSRNISHMRKQKAKELEEAIIDELKFLGFHNPQFKILVNQRQICAHGIDDVEFHFSANPGEPLKLLNKVASGGELSRLMLALKCVELKMAKRDLKAMTLIFDEIDSGIGGTVAENVSRRLKDLATYHQVLCITHLPQIAVLADHHLKVDKIIEDKKTKVTISVLSGKARKEEIARMLSGRITESSLFHAEELLKNK